MYPDLYDNMHGKYENPGTKLSKHQAEQVGHLKSSPGIKRGKAGARRISWKEVGGWLTKLFNWALWADGRFVVFDPRSGPTIEFS